jgi:hypothetical protein
MIKKIVAIEIPTALYNTYTNDINDICEVVNINDHIYICEIVKEMEVFAFTNETLREENTENVTVHQTENERLKNFFEVEVPKVFEMWNSFNDVKLTELKKANTDEKVIKEYFSDQKLTFENNVTTNIFYMASK